MIVLAFVIALLGAYATGMLHWWMADEVVSGWIAIPAVLLSFATTMFLCFACISAAYP